MSTTAKANAVDGENQTGAYYTGLNFTVNRYRAPSVVITGITRASGGTATISITVIDTGYGASGQVNTNIRKLQYTLNGEDWNDITPTWSGLSGTLALTGLTDNTRYNSFAVRAVNKYPVVALSDKTGSAFPLIMLEYTPAFMVWSDSNATGNQAPVGLSTQALVVSDDFDTAVDKGWIVAKNGIKVGANNVYKAGDFTNAGLALLDDADATAQRTTLGLGTAAVANLGTGATDAATGNHGHSDLAKAVNRQNYTTNSTVSNQLVQMGWSYVVGNDSASTPLTKAITFPVEYDSAPIVYVTSIGAKATSGGAPSVITDFNNQGNIVAGLNGSIATTGFTARLMQVLSYNAASSYNFGFSWIAIGTKAR